MTKYRYAPAETYPPGTVFTVQDWPGLGNEDDPINPSHYKGTNGIEADDVIEGFGLSYRLGSAVAYLLRAGKKGDKREDIEKAIWFLKREVERMK